MTKQSDVTPEGWKALAAGPLMVGLYVSLSRLRTALGVKA